MTVTISNVVYNGSTITFSYTISQQTSSYYTDFRINGIVKGSTGVNSTGSASSGNNSLPASGSSVELTLLVYAYPDPFTGKLQIDGKTITVSNTSTPPPTTTTTTPTLSVRADVANPGTVILSWTDVIGAVAWFYQVSKNGGSFVNPIPGLTFTSTDRSTSYKDDTITTQTTLTFHIAAVLSNGGFSPYSNMVSVTITPAESTPPPIQVPPAPDLVIENSLKGATYKYISWTPLVTATAYSLEQRYKGGTWVAFPDDPTPNFEIQLALGDGLYEFRVRAKNSTGYGAYSNIVSATLTTVTPPPPTTTNQKAVLNVQAVTTQIRLVLKPEHSFLYKDFTPNTQTSFQARSFTEQILQQSHPNIPTTLTAFFLAMTTQEIENELAVAQQLASLFSSTPTTPPPTVPPSSGSKNIVEKVVGAAIGAIVTGLFISQIKLPKRGKRAKKIKIRN